MGYVRIWHVLPRILLMVNRLKKPDHWLRQGNVWEIERLEYSYSIKFGGHTELQTDENGEQRYCWIATSNVLAVLLIRPIPGYQNGTVNTLRLWKAWLRRVFNLEEFNAGDYAEAVAAKITAEMSLWCCIQ